MEDICINHLELANPSKYISVYWYENIKLINMYREISKVDKTNKNLIGIWKPKQEKQR